MYNCVVYFSTRGAGVPFFTPAAANIVSVLDLLYKLVINSLSEDSII